MDKLDRMIEEALSQEDRDIIDETREQVHVIQNHLGLLSKDFDRFRERMDRLARHIRQANQDVEEVHVSARKISDRFGKIERVELTEEEKPELIYQDE